MRIRISIACGLLLLPLIASGCGNNNGVRNKGTGIGEIISQQSGQGMGGRNSTTPGQTGRSTTSGGMTGYGTSSTGGGTSSIYGTGSTGGGMTGYGTGTSGGGMTGYSTGNTGGGMSGYGTSSTGGGTFGYNNSNGSGANSYGTGMSGTNGYGTGSGYGTSTSGGSSMSGYGTSTSGGSMSGYGTGSNGTTNLQSQIRQKGYNDILVLGDTIIVGLRGTYQGQSNLRGLNANILTVTDDKAIKAIQSVKRKLTAISNPGPKAASISSDIRLILSKARPTR
ncbi:hypothetical protein [Paenibacillus sp. R14(2021)]|uniref:hypothetical protein n=1 Tax=Paenibacillus sp. R14(2021) TaxID=2859228 RepID=UPI001C612193|nr:hypothetical protein [Paenibacillus sp. R14(2021)]